MSTEFEYEYTTIRSKWKQMFLKSGWEIVSEISGTVQLRRKVQN